MSNTLYLTANFCKKHFAFINVTKTLATTSSKGWGVSVTLGGSSAWRNPTLQKSVDFNEAT